MTTSLYMPDVKVEIAFNSNFSTPAASRTWTDVSAYVELEDSIVINFGRGDELATPDANTLTLTLDNSDGRFTPFRAASPYYPNVKLDRPIRVTATPVGGGAVVNSPRFVGYIDEWPVEWEGTDAYSKVTITASSRMSRLGLLRPLRSVVEEEILNDSPTLYYTLSEPEGSRAALDTSGNDGPALVPYGRGPAIAWGTGVGPTTDGLAAPVFAGGRVLSAPVSIAVNTAATDMWLGISFSTTSNTLGLMALCDDTGPILANVVELSINGDGTVSCSTSTGAFVTTAAPYNDGEVHYIAARLTATGIVLYIDQALSGTSAGAPALSGTFTRLVVGDVSGYGNPFIGTLAHAEVGMAAITGPRLVQHGTAMLTGFDGETAGQWTLRVARWVGIPTAEVVLDTPSAATISAFDSNGASVADIFQRLADAEDGVIFDRRDGKLEYQNRTHRHSPTPAIVLDMEEQEVESDYAPKLDRSTLLNDVTLTNPTSTVSAQFINRSSISEYGYAALSSDTLTWDPSDVASLAAWKLAVYKEPRVRVPSLSVNLAPVFVDVSRANAFYAATISTYIQVANQPAQSDIATSAYFIEGIVETYGVERLTMSLNLSPGFPYDSLFVIDSSAIDGPDLIAI